MLKKQTWSLAEGDEMWKLTVSDMGVGGPIREQLFKWVLT